jgi:pimeloyl-[acyl-carrier protein] methyl ester esterase
MSLYVECRGSGPDLVLVHGWGLHGGIWDGLSARLENRYRVSSVDLPGHGRSDWQGQQTLDDWVTAVLEVVPDKAAWLGWSLGGLVATRAALQTPGRVTALVTMASTPCFVRRPGWQSAMLPELLETFSMELEQDYVRTLGRFLALQVRGSKQPGIVLGELRDSLLAHGEPNAEALAAGLAILRDTDLRDVLPTIKVPLLMIMGERDTLVPVNAGKETLALCTDAQLDIIDGAGHAPFLAAPGKVVERVDRFLSVTVPPALDRYCRSGL